MRPDYQIQGIVDEYRRKYLSDLPDIKAYFGDDSIYSKIFASPLIICIFDKGSRLIATNPKRINIAEGKGRYAEDVLTALAGFWMYSQGYDEINSPNYDEVFIKKLQSLGCVNSVQAHIDMLPQIKEERKKIKLQRDLLEDAKRTERARRSNLGPPISSAGKAFANELCSRIRSVTNAQSQNNMTNSQNNDDDPLGIRRK